jgi:undecaprenyl-diphosphatase
LEFIKAITLGIIQGFTEFLPISSSGHLVIASELLNFQEQGVVFDVFLHLGTLLSVAVVFRKELLAMTVAPLALLAGKRDSETRLYFAWDLYLMVATIPAVVAGLFLKEKAHLLFGNLLLVYSMLMVTAVLMICSKYLREGNMRLNWPRSLLVGLAQACAILPGLSRSGSTIFVGMALGMNREVVARFSFIMSVPVIVGAAVLQSQELIDNPPSFDSLVNIGAGTAMAAISGYFAIVLLLDIVRRNRLQWFGYYCMVVAGLGFLHHFFG